MCDKYHIDSRHDIYEARNKITKRRYARYKATPRRWRELRRDGTSIVENEALIDTLEAAVCEFLEPRDYAQPCSDRPRLRFVPTARQPLRKPREWRGEVKR